MIELFHYLPESATLLKLKWVLFGTGFTVDVIKAGRAVEIFSEVGKQHIVKVWESKLGSNVIWQGLEHNRVEDLRPLFSHSLPPHKVCGWNQRYGQADPVVENVESHTLVRIIIICIVRFIYCRWSGSAGVLVCVCALLVWTELDTVKQSFDDV